MRLSPSLAVFAAEALALPTGLITVVFLARTLGAENYGAYVVALLVVSWAQVVLAALLSRPAQAFIARASDGRAAAADTLLLHVLIGGSITGLIALGSAPIANLLRHPGLSSLLVLASLDTVFFAAALGCRSAAMAADRFGLRAAMAALRWILRLVLIVILVLSGFGLGGAIVGGVAASAVELLLGLAVLRLPAPRFDLSRLKGFFAAAAPVSVGALGCRLFEKADLLFIQALSGAVAAGLYGAAQNVTIVAALFGMSYGGVLVTEVARLSGEPQGLAKAAQRAMRLCLLLAPPAALGAALAPLIVGMAFGPPFEAAAPLVAILSGAALFMIWAGLSTAILTGSGHGRLVLLTAGPALPLAVAGHLIVIPIYGPMGAAACTLAVALLSALAGWAAVIVTTKCRVPKATLAGALVLCGVIGAVAVAAAT